MSALILRGAAGPPVPITPVWQPSETLADDLPRAEPAKAAAPVSAALGAVGDPVRPTMRGGPRALPLVSASPFAAQHIAQEVLLLDLRPMKRDTAALENYRRVQPNRRAPRGPQKSCRLGV